MHVPEAGLRAVARVRLPYGMSHSLFAAQPIDHALHLPAGTALNDVLAASHAITFPGTARPTTTALLQSTQGWSLVPLGIIRTSSGERVFGPVRLNTLHGVVDAPLVAIQRRMEQLVGLTDESLHAMLV